jgi:hypothetical protein
LDNAGPRGARKGPYADGDPASLLVLSPTRLARRGLRVLPTRCDGVCASVMSELRIEPLRPELVVEAASVLARPSMTNPLHVSAFGPDQADHVHLGPIGVAPEVQGPDSATSKRTASKASASSGDSASRPSGRSMCLASGTI